MGKRVIRVKVPEILKARALDAYDLMFGTRISLNTAQRWADLESAKTITRVDLENLVKIADYLEVGNIADLLDFVDDE